MRSLLWLLIFVPLVLVGQSDIRVHDPVIHKHGDSYYLFCTGIGISTFVSKDLTNWTSAGKVFDSPPIWALEAVPGFKGHIWAPDISYHNGRYVLYYSVSAFGKNTSCIGMASNETLDPQSPHYKWTDHGKVVESVPGRDLWNAIDPNFVVDQKGTPWLSFGSFWSGIKLFRLSEDLGAPAEPQEWYTIARRVRDSYQDDKDPEPAAIEAPFIFRKGPYYFLFVSFDFCCRGLKSTYKVMVGRSENIWGPYLDKDGIRMDQGGGSLVLAGNDVYAGVGHNAVYTWDGRDYFVCHGYDALDEGKPKLIVREIKWDNSGWPTFP